MHHITMHLDFVSPYAWLAFAQLPQALQGLSCRITYRPVLLGALLKAHANPGPVGIGSKRVWTYRHVQWLAQQSGTTLQLPAQHPFNPLPLLRLALQGSDDGSISRHTAERVFEHVWCSGADALDPARLAQLQATLQGDGTLGPPSDSEAAAAQAQHWLRSNTQSALEAGIFGVPSWSVGNEVFWGLEALPMLSEFLRGAPWFSTQGWENAKTISSGLA